jgi:hypothetical protein
MEKGVGIILLFILFCRSEIKGQKSAETNKDDKYKISVSSAKNLTIAFENRVTIDQLLVLVYDDKGETIFMDSQYNFKGDYSRSVDLSKGNSATYSLKIIYRDEKIDRSISIKP